MFAKMCKCAVSASLAILLSACGGGSPDNTDSGVLTMGTNAAPDVYAASVASLSGSAAQQRQRGPQAEAAPSGGRVLNSRDNDPDIADDAARAQMAAAEAGYEASFSLEMNRRHAEHEAHAGAAEPAVQQAYVPHQDCTDLRLAECSGS